MILSGSKLTSFGSLAFVLITYPVCAQDRTPIAKSGATSISATVNGAKIGVTIHTVKIDRSNPLFPLGDAWDAKVMSAVGGLEITVDGQSLAVPHSVLSDLFDPREASIRSEKGDFVLRVDGADASNSYFIRIFFDTVRVKRLVLYSSLFPNHPTADTRYYTRVLKDE